MEWEGCGRECPWPDLRQCREICRSRLSKFPYTSGQPLNRESGSIWWHKFMRKVCSRKISQKNARLFTNTWLYVYYSEISWSEKDFWGRIEIYYVTEEFSCNSGLDILSIFLSMANKIQRCIILFIVNAVHVSSDFSAHHQELKSVHAASSICQTCLLLPLALQLVGHA
jgi:hypothetical protein